MKEFKLCCILFLLITNIAAKAETASVITSNSGNLYSVNNTDVDNALSDMYNEVTGCYDISSVSDFKRFAEFVNQGNSCVGMTFVVTVSELDFKDEKDFVNVGMFYDSMAPRFDGTFDGRGVLMKNVNILRSDGEGMFSTRIALFAYVKGEVKNIVMDSSCHIAGKRTTGSIVGYLVEGGLVYNCHSSATVEGTESVGGIVGDTDRNTTIDGCSFSGKVTGETILGGIVGNIYIGVLVSNCVNDGEVESTQEPEGSEVNINDGYKLYGADVGGIVGKNLFGTIRNCTNNGEISGPSFIGGIVGQNYEGVVKECANNAKIYATDGSVGGITGFNRGDNNNWQNSYVIQCKNLGEIQAKNYSGGGIVGTNIGTIASCINSGNVTCGKKRSGTATVVNPPVPTYFSRCGGISGFESGIIQDCIVSKGVIIKGEDSRVGGISGQCYTAEIKGCTVEESTVMSDFSEVGGIVGEARFKCKIIECINRAEISGTHVVGGIVGSCSTNPSDEPCEIIMCVNRGNVTATNGNYAGGIAGTVSDIIRQSISKGNITANDSYSGGIVGKASDGVITDCMVLGGVIKSNAVYVGAIAGYISASQSGETFISENYYSKEVVVIHQEKNYEKETPRGVGAFKNEDPYDLPEYSHKDMTGYNCAVLKLDYEPPYEVSLNDFTLITDSTYAIASVDDMIKLASYVNDGNCCEGLTFQVTVEELVFSNVDNYEPIGHDGKQFAGNLDGQGVVIKNLRINKADFDCVGLLGYLTGTVCNVNIDSSCSINGGYYVGGIAGKCWGGTIKNCLVGTQNNGTAAAKRLKRNTTNSQPLSSISGSNYVGGILGGNFFGQINDCSVNSITLAGDSYVGAIIGNNTNGVLSENYYHKSVIITMGEIIYDGVTPRGLGAAANSQPSDVQEIIVDRITYYNGTALNDETGIKEIFDFKCSPFNDLYYNLKGQKVADSRRNDISLPKGIYIYRGRKFIIR